MYDSNNYGAALQALATVKFIEKNGYDAEIIRYQNTNEKDSLRIIYKENGKAIGYLKSFARNIIFGRYFYSKRAFKEFLKSDIFSDKSYTSIEELKAAQYDILIAGSDQIWNPKITNGIDNVFLLNFNTAVRKISISSSLGSYNLTDEDKIIYGKALSDFYAVSVREKEAKEQLENLISKPIKVVMDPTFLLNKDDWNNLLKSTDNTLFKKNRGKYILTYFISGEKKNYKSIIKSYSEKFGLPVWAIQYSNYSWKENDKKLLGLKLCEFIDAFSNAAIVLTDSFHGVAFSLNLHVDFVALNNTLNPVRVKSLLNKLDIEERLNMPVERYSSVNYDSLNNKLEENRQDTVEWVSRVLMN